MSDTSRPCEQLYRYFFKDTEVALDMTLLELHWILQVFCVSEEEGEGVNQGS
jgi:hypothetical protein